MPSLKIIADLKEHEQQRIAILEDGKLAEIFIEYAEQDDVPENGSKQNAAKISKLSREGDIFKARIDTILPAINAAFLALSNRKDNQPRNAFIYLDELGGLKAGQNIVVQVIKNARGNKAPRVSSRISLPGRWTVIVPNTQELGVSRRIEDNKERKRLKAIADEFKAALPGFGVVIRTAAQGVSRELLQADLNSLLQLWDDIEHKAQTTPAPCLLYRDTGTLGRVLRDEVAGEIDELIIDDPDEFERTESFISRFFTDKPNLQLYEGSTPIFDYFGVEQEIMNALDRKVWLRSGAYLVIDQTEALTVIDVNSGKFTSAPDLRHTTLAVNLEAADEIARQLRLRCVGGIVVVDFIDMDEESDRNTLLEHFGECLKHDRLRARVFSITQLGLVELTRKRSRQDLRSLLTRNCPMCAGNGWVEREENIATRIKRFLRKVTSANNSEAFIIQTSRHIAEHIYQFLSEWQEEFGWKIFLAAVSGFEMGKFRLEFQGSLKDAEARAKQLRLQGKGTITIYRT